jgi:hypothetical protein
VESDPIGLGSGVNTYAYGEDDPVMVPDRFGLDTAQCTRRLNNVPFRVGPLFHQYVCVGNAKTGYTCRGLGPSGNMFNALAKSRSTRTRRRRVRWSCRRTSVWSLALRRRSAARPQTTVSICPTGTIARRTRTAPSRSAWLSVTQRRNEPHDPMARGRSVGWLSPSFLPSVRQPTAIPRS